MDPVLLVTGAAALVGGIMVAVINGSSLAIAVGAVLAFFGLLVIAIDFL